MYILIVRMTERNSGLSVTYYAAFFIVKAASFSYYYYYTRNETSLIFVNSLI